MYKYNSDFKPVKMEQRGTEFNIMRHHTTGLKAEQYLILKKAINTVAKFTDQLLFAPTGNGAIIFMDDLFNEENLEDFNQAVGIINDFNNKMHNIVYPDRVKEGEIEITTEEDPDWEGK